MESGQICWQDFEQNRYANSSEQKAERVKKNAYILQDVEILSPVQFDISFHFLYSFSTKLVIVTILQPSSAAAAR